MVESIAETQFEVSQVEDIESDGEKKQQLKNNVSQEEIKTVSRKMSKTESGCELRRNSALYLSKFELKREGKRSQLKGAHQKLQILSLRLLRNKALSKKWSQKVILRKTKYKCKRQVQIDLLLFQIFLYDSGQFQKLLELIRTFDTPRKFYNQFLIFWFDYIKIKLYIKMNMEKHARFLIEEMLHYQSYESLQYLYALASRTFLDIQKGDIFRGIKQFNQIEKLKAHLVATNEFKAQIQFLVIEAKIYANLSQEGLLMNFIKKPSNQVQYYESLAIMIQHSIQSRNFAQFQQLVYKALSLDFEVVLFTISHIRELILSFFKNYEKKLQNFNLEKLNCDFFKLFKVKPLQIKKKKFQLKQYFFAQNLLYD